MSNITLAVCLKTALCLVAVTVVMICGESRAQDRAPVRIGGENGVIMGGGMGFKVGGRNGIHFGGGQGAKFGPTEFGMHFGNGQGARFGGESVGMQFGGGQGARFGTPEFGMQFGHGEGARFGAKENPAVQFGGGQGAVIGRQSRGQQRDQQIPPLAEGEYSVLKNRSNESVPPSTGPTSNPVVTHPTGKDAFSVWEK